jgi:hypothetical protein
VARFLLCLLLLLLPSSVAGSRDRVDCGISPGERYTVTLRGLVFPDGSLLVNWSECKIPEGVVLTVAWDEAGPVYSLEVYPACSPSPEARQQLIDLVKKAKAALSERGVDPDAVPTTEMPCVARPHVDIRRTHETKTPPEP